MINIIAGVDEAGRGPLAGPVVAAAVILNPDYKIENLKDSKLLKSIPLIIDLMVSSSIFSSINFLYAATVITNPLGIFIPSLCKF